MVYQAKVVVSIIVTKTIFKNIDNYSKAYWLGFLLADGCVYKRKNNINAQKWLRICLQQQDLNLLNQFKNCLSSNHPIKSYIRKTDGRQYCAICIVSNQLCNDLSNYGCKERKTGKIFMPKFKTDQLSWGFIHGYTDGDGCISKCRDKNVFRYQFSIVGNKKIIYDIHDFLQTQNVVSYISQDKRKYSFDFFSIKVEKMSDLKTIFDNTYLSHNIGLKRKHERVLEYINNKYNKNLILTNI